MPVNSTGSICSTPGEAWIILEQGFKKLSIQNIQTEQEYEKKN